MSLGPAGATLNPEQAENFEDASHLSHMLPPWKSNSLSKVPLTKATLSIIKLNPHMTAVQHMTTYWSLLEGIPGSKLRLTKMDDEIYEDFKATFSEFDPKETIDEDKMKSKEGKAKWRDWMMKYEKTVDDYNFGTMLRSNPKFEYGEKETIFAMRMQFYAIEIARNKLGLNDWIAEQAKKA